MSSPQQEADEHQEGLVNLELGRIEARTEALRRIAARDQPTDVDLDKAYLGRSALAELPVSKPLISGVLDRNSYVVLSGRDHTFKSFIALDWALCLATGMLWQGRRAEKVKVLYVVAEGKHGMHQRIKAWETHHGVTVSDEYFTAMTERLDLYAGGPVLEHLLHKLAADKYVLVVLDTLRKVSGAADGNSSQMGVVIDNVDRIRRATDDGTVLVPAHTTKTDKDTRGYSGIEDDADAVWHTERADRSPDVELTNTKMKDGPESGPILLRLNLVDGSAVLVHRLPGADTESGSAADKLMAVMWESFPTSGASVNDLVELTKVPRSTLYPARGRLQKDGRLVVRGHYAWLPEAAPR